MSFAGLPQLTLGWKASALFVIWQRSDDTPIRRMSQGDTQLRRAAGTDDTVLRRMSQSDTTLRRH